MTGTQKLSQYAAIAALLGLGNHSVWADQTPAEDASLTEIVVSAQKRGDERLQDVPIPISVIDARALIDTNELRLQDYYEEIPGVSFSSAPNAGNNQLLAIRGITSSSSENRTVSILVDDVPVGQSASVGASGNVVPDIDPDDLARVEVMRGPQGTLYGASSMGGLVKFVTLDPSTDSLSGRVMAGTSSVHNGAEPGYNFRASVNIPISDSLAIRASGFTRQDPGYIDNPVLGVEGINEAHATGGHFAALWKPTDVFSLKLSALIQNYHADGLSDVDVTNAAAYAAGYTGPALGDLQQNYIRGINGPSTATQVYGATMTGKIGGIDLTSVSGYGTYAEHDNLDITYALGTCTLNGCGTGFSGFGVTGTPIFSSQKSDKFTQEVRAGGSLWRQVDWLLGVFYTHERSAGYQDINATNPTTGEFVGRWAYIPFPSTYQEYAAFTDLTYHFTDRFDVQIGGRESHIHQTLSEAFVGPYAPVFLGMSSPFLYPEHDETANAFTYLVTPRFKVSSDIMVYARLASGYRPGNANLYAGPGTPPSFSPDKTENYEVGIKGDFLEHKLSVDASLYYIDWKNIQLSLINQNTLLGYNGNGAGAKSEGVELSFKARPISGLTLSAWIAYDDAALTQDFPAYSAVYGAAGYRLPYSPRISGTFSPEQEFPVVGGVTGFVGGSLSYVGNREGEFNAPPPTVPERQYFSPYAKTNLHLGGRYRSWTLNLYADNVTDRRGVVGGGLYLTPPYAFSYIQPRTIGLNLSTAF